MDDRKPIDEFTAEAISALNSLMTCEEICINDKSVIKINHFKKWLLTLNKVLTENKVSNN